MFWGNKQTDDIGKAYLRREATPHFTSSHLFQHIIPNIKGSISHHVYTGDFIMPNSQTDLRVLFRFFFFFPIYGTLVKWRRNHKQKPGSLEDC